MLRGFSTLVLSIDCYLHIVHNCNRNNSNVYVLLQKVLKEELGEHWFDLLEDFDRQPLAAASIGQVHRAILKDGTEVAMKIQVPYP